MSEEELLRVYLQRVSQIALERLREQDIRALDAIQEALHYLQGEMQGY